MKQDNQHLDNYVPFDFNQLVVPAAQPQEQSVPSEPIVMVEEPQIKVFCKECRKEINKTTSILSDGVYRCVVCFAKAEHPSDSFQVIRPLNYPLADPGWKAMHEVLFLSFLEKFGIGNWKEIKEQLDFYGVKFREDELESHYYNCYLANEDFMPKFLNNESFFQKRCEQISSIKGPNQVNPTSISSLTTAHQTEHYEEIDYFYNLHQEVSQRETKFLECYNNKRNQFQIQYDQDAELILANLEFRDDDCEQEIRIKFQMIQEYNRRLERRNHVKKFVLEHRLLEDHYQKEMDKSRTQLEKEAFQELKPIARLTTLPQYNQLVRKVAFTKQLKSTIEGLRKFRRTHPSNFKSLDEFLNSQPEQGGRPRKKVHNQNAVKTGKKMQQLLEKHFKLTKRDFDHIIATLTANGKKTVYKNVEAVLLQSNSQE